MLLIIGTVLEIVRGTIQTKPNANNPNGGSFAYTDVRLLVGKSKVESIRVGDDFVGALPSEGQEVALSVYASAFATRSGASYRLNAVSDVSDRVKVAQPAGA